MRPRPDAVYLITDGLPTLGEPLGKFTISLATRSCLNAKGRISPDCRHLLFQKATYISLFYCDAFIYLTQYN